MVQNKNNVSGYRIIFAVLSVICMIVIFFFSSENGTDSSATSDFFADFITRNMIKDYDKMSLSVQAETVALVGHIVRKTAHFLIYTALGICVSFTAGKHQLISAKSAVSFIICFCYACTDELHQYFVPGRECKFTDVLIDSAGSLTGIIISILVIKAADALIIRRNPS